MILMYYSILGLFFLAGGAQYSGYTNNINLNSTNMTSGEIDQGGLFGTGVSFGRFIGLVTIGIGLPADTPSWFLMFFFTWQTLVTVFTVGFVIASIWNG